MGRITDAKCPTCGENLHKDSLQPDEIDCIIDFELLECVKCDRFFTRKFGSEKLE
ncbi:hypothetical protein RY280_23435 [Bacillus paralicheniformis]|uniref:hypothetical protein n=1 Tax=Bacillus paralicheniformis TaxID=1648923 RepID=UPI003D99888F